MPRPIDLKSYIDAIENGLIPFEFPCRSCGASSLTTSGQHSTFCNFCEGYVNIDGTNAIHGSSDVEKRLLGMNAAAKSGQWLQGVPYADALAATKDPYFLYGASHFYKYFSDFVYHDVNYNLGGFMYSNAEKRSDELLKNKYNAMALISKSKEHLFKALKVISTIPPEPKLIYLKLMCNVRLNRYSTAASIVEDLRGFDGTEDLLKYSGLVISTEAMKSGSKPASIPNIGSASGSANFFYYLAKYFAKSGDLESASALLDKIAENTFMPMAASYNRKIAEVKGALDF